MRWRDRLDGGVGVGHRDGVRRRAEGAGDGGLVAGPHRQQRGDRAEQPGHRVGGGQQGAGAVLAVEPHLEGVLAGQQPGAVAVGLLGLVAGLGEPLLDVVEQGAGRLVLGVEALLAGVEAGDPGLERGEVALGAVGAGHGVLAGQAEPPDLVGGRGGAGLERVDLAVQPGQSLAAVGGGALEAGDPAFLLGRGVLGGLAGRDRLLEPGALAVDLGGDPLLLLADALGLGLELVGVAAGPRVVVLGGAGGVADPLGGERLGAAQPLAQPGEREPGLLGGGEGGQVLAQGGLEGGLGLAGRRDGRLDLPAALEQDRLVGELLLQGGAGGDEVVGHQPGAGVADVGLHGRRPAGPPRPGGRAA